MFNCVATTATAIIIIIVRKPDIDIFFSSWFVHEWTCKISLLHTVGAILLLWFAMVGLRVKLWLIYNWLILIIRVSQVPTLQNPFPRIKTTTTEQSKRKKLKIGSKK